jgi:hypothetical protein
MAEKKQKSPSMGIKKMKIAINQFLYVYRAIKFDVDYINRKQ